MSAPRARRSGMPPARALLGACLALALLPAPTAQGAERGAADCTNAFAERVQQHYDGIRDLRARFRQTTERASLGGSPAGRLEARGEVVLAKPGRMRWSYEEPAPSLVVSDGKTLWIYDPPAKEVQEMPLGPGFLSGAALQFLMGEGRLLDEFSVVARGCGAPEIELLLSPRRDSYYERLELAADAKTGAVRRTAVVDLLGNRTTVSFDDLRANTGPDPALFRFVPPADVRVLAVPPSP